MTRSRVSVTVSVTTMAASVTSVSLATMTTLAVNPVTVMKTAHVWRTVMTKDIVSVTWRDSVLVK